MSWTVQRAENVRFSMSIEGDRRVILINGAGVRVNSVSVRFRRDSGGQWEGPVVGVTYGKGWELTAVSVPQGLRGGRTPDWLAQLASEVQP